MTTNRLQCRLEFKVNGRRSHKTVKIVNFLDQVCIIIMEFSAIRLPPIDSKFQALPKGNIAVIQLGRCTIPTKDINNIILEPSYQKTCVLYNITWRVRK